MSEWLLVDGNNIVTRCFQARYRGSEEPPPVEICTTAIAMIRKQIDALQLDMRRVEVAFDAGYSYRKELFPGYKADRHERPEGLQAALDLFPEMMHPRWAWLRVEGWEADDVLHTRKGQLIMRDKDATIIVYSTDSDLLQLIEEFRCMVVQPLKEGKSRDWTLKAFFDEYRFIPAEYPHYKALIGDNSDCLPQVPGVGKVWGRRMIQAHGTIDELYQTLKATPPDTLSKLQRAILDCEEQVRLNLVLGTLQDVPGL